MNIDEPVILNSGIKKDNKDNINPSRRNVPIPNVNTMKLSDIYETSGHNIALATAKVNRTITAVLRSGMCIPPK